MHRRESLRAAVLRVFFRRPLHAPTSERATRGKTLSPSIFFKLYAVALTTFLVIDLVWLGVVARPFYQRQLGHLMRPNVNWAAAIAFYLVFVTGIVVLVVWPAIEKQSPAQALVLGALLGLVTYAAYDLTSLAVMEGFPLKRQRRHLRAVDQSALSRRFHGGPGATPSP